MIRVPDRREENEDAQSRAKQNNDAKRERGSYLHDAVNVKRKGQLPKVGTHVLAHLLHPYGRTELQVGSFDVLECDAWEGAG